MADMGFDDKNLEVLVVARRIKTPVAYVQIRGRVLRRCDANDPRNIKKHKGYAVLADLAGSALDHEKKEIIERVEGDGVEEGEGFSSQGVYADLVGGLKKEGVREVEASVEVKPRKTFMVLESELESSTSPEKVREEVKRRKSLKVLLREIEKLFPSDEKLLRKYEEDIEITEEEIEEIEREIEE
jgi:superfamily II DNA or RNA helicase